MTSKALRMLGCGLVLTSAAALASCTNFEAGHPGNPQTENFSLDAAKAALAKGSGFTGDLGANYYALATRRAKDGDKVDADYWARKSLAASQGQVVQPEDLHVAVETSNGVPAEAAQPIAAHDVNWLVAYGGAPNEPTARNYEQARAALVRALDQGGRDRFPTLAARAQAWFDCSIERGEANTGSPLAGTCYRNFARDYTDLNVLLNPPGQLDSYFALNSAELTPEGQQQLTGLANFIKLGTAKLSIVGKTDRSGTDKYNMQLSQQRAQVVKDAAVAAGLPADRIDVSWTGEKNLPVKTKDGVKEAKNRLVESDIVMPASQVAMLQPQE